MGGGMGGFAAHPPIPKQQIVIPNAAERNEESPHVCVITLVRIHYNEAERNEESLVLVIMRFLPTVPMTTSGNSLTFIFTAPGKLSTNSGFLLVTSRDSSFRSAPFGRTM